MPDKLTRQDMKNAMYYFIDNTNLHMVHYNTEAPRDPFRMQEDYLGDRMRKCKRGFAIINLFLD